MTISRKEYGMDPFTVMAFVSAAMGMLQGQQQMKAQRKAAQQQMAEAAKQRWEEYEKAEKKRKDDLKKALAKRRARMGAGGFSAADGSAGAIIQGLRTDKAEATHEDFTNAKEQINANNQSISANLMEQSKAHQRQMFKQAGGIASSITGIQEISPLVDFAADARDNPQKAIQGGIGFVADKMQSSGFDDE